MSQKIKISTLRDLVNSKIKFEDVSFEVKKYLPFKDKVNLIDRIVSLSVVKTNNINKVNYAFKSFFYEIELIRAYSNIDFSTIDKHIDNSEQYLVKLLEFYDMLKESKIIDCIISLIPTEEKVFIKHCIDEQIAEERNVNNSLVVTIGNFIDMINTKIPEMEQAIKNFKPEDFKFIAEALKLNNNLSA